MKILSFAIRFVLLLLIAPIAAVIVLVIFLSNPDFLFS